MVFKYIISITSILITIFSTTANSALISRLGGMAYYDDILDITWLSDANYSVTSGYAELNATGEQNNWGNIQVNGLMDGNEANNWAADLNIFGATGWRLPNMDVNGDGNIINCGVTSVSREACKDNEFSYLYFYGAGTVPDNGITASMPGPFVNVQDFSYWSGTFSTPDPQIDSWYMYLPNGSPIVGARNMSYYAWAVYDGDVALSAIPIPSTIWLLSSGLLGLYGLVRRKKHNK